MHFILKPQEKRTETRVACGGVTLRPACKS